MIPVCGSGAFGCGEPSFVVKDDTLYIYYTYMGTLLNQTRVYTASSNNSNWPGSMTYRGVALNRESGEDSTDIKYLDGMNKFIGVSVRNRFTTSSCSVFYESSDGISFSESNILTDYIEECSHNSGISGRCDGYLNLGDQNFIAYAYGATWGHWSTYLTPIHFNELVAVKKYYTGTGTIEAHIMSGLNNFSSFILHTNTNLHETGDDWQFIASDWNDDTKTDLFVIKKIGGSGKTEVHIMDGSTNYQTYLAHIATVLETTNSDWNFDLADWNGDGVLDLFCINRVGNSSKTEVSILNGADNFTSYLTQIVTVLHVTDSTWDFEVSDYNDDGMIVIC